jgi:hypothetical protein
MNAAAASQGYAAVSFFHSKMWQGRGLPFLRAKDVCTRFLAMSREESYTVESISWC